MRKCELCAKSYRMGGKRKLLRGHYNPTTRKKKKANLQRTRLPDSCKPLDKARGKRALVCTQCLKTITKRKSTT